MQIQAQENAGTTPVVEARPLVPLPKPRAYLIIKRAMDIILAATLLLIVAPIILWAIFRIKRESPGPAIFCQRRVGKDGIPFTFYKLRSMVDGAELLRASLETRNERPDGPYFKMVKDPRVTPFGEFLRRSSIDELPQLFNVLRGDMSLVGPRPHQPQEVEKYPPEARIVLTVLPGITGMAQVDGRDQNPFLRENHLDALYVRQWTPLVDLRILWHTVGVVLRRAFAKEE